MNKKNIKEMKMLEKGKLSTYLVSIVLFAGVLLVGFIIQNPEVMATIIGLPLWLKISGIILPILVTLFDYAYPRLSDKILKGEDTQFTQGGLTTFLMIVAVTLIYTIAMAPSLLTPFLGNSAEALIPIIGGMALIIWNFLKPRYGYLMENIMITGSKTKDNDSEEKTESTQEDKQNSA